MWNKVLVYENTDQTVTAQEQQEHCTFHMFPGMLLHHQPKILYQNQLLKTNRCYRPAKDKYRL